jgi:short-chain 2-methylacyl-CoA dehydrogenase
VTDGSTPSYSALPWCYTDEHEAWRASVRSFAEREVAPVSAESYAKHRFPEELMPKLAELGCFGLFVGTEHGGAAADLTSLCIAVEELARVDVSVAATVHVQASNAGLLEALGDESQVREILPRAVRGEAFICFCLTEASGGSDARNVATTATHTDSGWVLNGSKQFITNSGTPSSEYAIVFATTRRAGTSELVRGVSAFLVPLATPGVTVDPAYDKLGWHASDTHPVFFDNVELPSTALLGEEGGAFQHAKASLTWGRVPVGAISVGLAQGCLDETLKFVQERETFGVRLAERQHVAFQCADLAAIAAAGRTLVYDACWKYDHGHPITREAAICKYVTTELANKAAYIATQLHGGYGFMNESRVARHYADARVLTIVEGTSEIQRMLIARSLGLPV